jgi:predicted glycoside hydrolase/deacetylase ChbG (UPF0249 family)
MQKNLLIVADDLGLAPAVDRAVLYGIQHHVISAPAVMPTSTYADALLRDFRNAGYASIGWHLTLSERTQRPLTRGIAVLCDQDGRFLGRDPVVQRLADPVAALRGALRQEIEAQLNRIEQCGLRVSHISSHHHLHVVPSVANALVDVLRLRGLSPLVRGYGLNIGEPGSGAHGVLSAFAATSTRLYQEHGLKTTHTVGFRTFVAPTEATLREELNAPPSNAQPLEWMVHVADYAAGEARLSHAREEEFALLQRRPLLADFHIQRLVCA